MLTRSRVRRTHGSEVQLPPPRDGGSCMQPFKADLSAAFSKHGPDAGRALAVLTSSDVIQRGQHPQHEGGGDRDGVSGLLQHEFISRYNLGGKRDGLVNPSRSRPCPLRLGRRPRTRRRRGDGPRSSHVPSVLPPYGFSRPDSYYSCM